MQASPIAAEIMQEIRQGLSDTTLSDATLAKLSQSAGLQSDLRKAHEHAPVLGRCGGSIRGKCCNLFAPLLKPVIEQLDLYHNAIIRTLEHIAGTQSDTHARLENLELRLQELEAREPPAGIP